MNARLAFFGKCSVLAAATGLFIAGPLSLHAQNKPGDTITRAVASPKPLPRTETLNIVQSAVQRELEAIYARDGKKAPTFTRAAASQTLQNSSLSSDRRTIIRKSHTPQAKRETGLFSRSKDRRTANSTSWNPLTRIFKLSRQRPTAIASRSRKPSASSSLSSIRKPSAIRHAAAAVKSDKESADSTSNKSAVVQELEKLYKRDGKQMPSMNVSDMPKTLAGARKVSQSRKLSKYGPRTASKRNSSPSLLQRIFPFANRGKKSTPAVTPRSKHRIAATRRRPIAGQTGTRYRTATARTKTVQASKKPGLLPQFRSSQLPVIAAAKSIQPQTQPSRLAPSQSTKLKTVITPKQFGRPTTNSTPVADALAETKKNPFANVSENKQNSEVNPFTGLKLEEQTSQLTSAEKFENNPFTKLENAPEKSVPPRRISEPKQTNVVSSNEPAVRTDHSDKMKRIIKREGQAGLKGFCPVSLRDERKLADSQTEFSSSFQSKTYHFASAELKARFDQDPEKYVPVAHGYDVIHLSAGNKMVAGSLDFAVWYKDRLYLFSNNDSMQTFVSNPAEHAILAN